MILTAVGDRGEHKADQPRLWPNESGAPWTLQIVGEVENAQQYTLDELMERQHHEMPLDVECVSVGSIYKQGKAVAKFTGIFLDELLREAVPKPDAKTAVFVSAAPGWAGPTFLPHETPLELQLCQAPGQVLLAWALDGEPLEYPNGGPLRSVVDGQGLGEKRFFYKSLKWLSKIEVIADPLETCGRGGAAASSAWTRKKKATDDPAEAFTASLPVLWTLDLDYLQRWADYPAIFDLLEDALTDAGLKD